MFASDMDMAGMQAAFAEELSTDPKRIHLIRMDVSKLDDIQAAATQVQDMLRNLSPDGKLFGLVNNAGIARSNNEKTLRSMVELPDEEMKTMFDVDVFGVIRVTNAFYPMLARDPLDMTQAGAIVNVSSLAGIISLGYFNYYCACKHAVMGYTESLRNELSVMGVRVRCVNPTFVRTRIIELPPLDEKSPWYEDMKKKVPIMKKYVIDSPLSVSTAVDVMFNCLFTYMPRPPVATLVVDTKAYIATTFYQLLNRGMIS